MYQDLYNLIANAIFEASTLTGYQDLVITLVTTFAVLFLISIPFIIVFKVINIILGR